MSHTLAAPNQAREPTPNSFRSYVASAIGRGSPPAFIRLRVAPPDERPGCPVPGPLHGHQAPLRSA
jgi:hypothetical protein